MTLDFEKKILETNFYSVIIVHRTMSSGINIPRKLPLLLATNEVLLPGSALRIPVTTQQNMNMVKSRLLSRNTLASTIIGVLPKEPDYDLDGSRGRGSEAQIGTAAVVVQVTGTTWPRPSYTLLLSGLCRFRLDKLVMEQPYPVGVVTQLDRFSFKEDHDGNNAELSSLIESVRGEAAKLLEMLDVSTPTVKRLKRMLSSVPGHQLADVCASLVKASYAEKLQMLETLDLTERFKKILPIIMRQSEGLNMLQDAKKPVSQVPLTRFTRSQLVADDDAEDGEDDLQELHNRLKAARLPLQARKVAFKDLQRLRRLNPQSPEHGMLRSYIELMSELPWSRSSSETLDIHKARKDLDADHYAMEKLKRRVLEYLAVRQLRNSLRGPILCFIGPPGVGKTSVGRSIASTLGREFSRISVGGICNQSDIRGHRRTYVGSMPGRIIQGLKTVGVNNPVFLLDEIDKMGSGIHGDPAAALLEVLDPEQNCNFVDHYLNVPFDLSQVMFIATANKTSTIPAALLDRMEIIHVPGYTHEEKLHIAKLAKYTHEAGVRNLERKLGALCRAVAVKVAELRPALSKGKDEPFMLPDGPVVLDLEAIEDILGPPLYDHDLAGRMGQPGVAIGLAWTAAGGELMFVEASKMHGGGELTLTGQLGNVMKESARLALNWVRMHAAQYGVEFQGDLMTDTDVHIHFPAGAVGKDGPSAGITIVTALMSLFSGRPVATDLAMTGEVTLSGLVLAVGGIKEKVLAAHRGGLSRIIIPKKFLQAAFDGGLQMVNVTSVEPLESKL
ncbi:hypothetical protein B566_EDAN002564 [Ephemera danica]|nr:hypothetical protein B566_EDAN002564 [Ephemera danica]